MREGCRAARRTRAWPGAALVGAALVVAWARVAGCGRDAACDAAPAVGDDAMWQRHPLLGSSVGREGRAFVLWGYQDSPSEQPREGQGLVSIRAARSGDPWEAGGLPDGETLPAGRRGPTTSGAAKVPPNLDRALEISPGKLHDIQIRLSPPAGTVSLPQWLDDAIASGQVTGEASLAVARRAWVAHRRALAAEILDPAAAAVSARGGRVIERYPMLLGLRIAATRDMLLDVLQRFPVVLVDETPRFVADGQRAPRPIAVSRRAVADGHQLAQLSGSGGGAASALHMAMWERGGWPYPDAAAWRRGARPGLELLLHGCSAPDCSDAGARHSPHASATLAVLRADVLGTLSSGLTVHAHAIGRTSLARIIDDTIASVDDIRIVSMSASLDAGHDWSCRGVDLVSRDADALFEHGILLVKSAGNRGGSARGCTVGPPGAATTVLTVAALAAERDDAEGVRRAPVLAASAVGGTAGRLTAAGRWEAGERTVIGLAAQGCRREAIADTGRDFIGCGTSFSTPTAGAAALLQLAFWERDRRTAFFHHRPGALMAALLAMGDGFAPEAQGDGDARIDVGFDRRTGAGRLALRRFDRAGLDAPWGYQIAETCVTPAQEQYFPHEDGVVLRPGVNIIKAALFWYDPSIDDAGRFNDLDLSIERARDEPAPGRARQWIPVAASTHPNDNKERVIARGVGGQRLRVAVRGTRVRTPTTDPTCGDAQRAYLAYFFEDSRRDDPDGPTSISVAPESAP